MSLWNLYALKNAYNGDIQFSPAEKRAHLDGLEDFYEVAGACLQQELAEHQEFHRRWGISKFFGEKANARER